MLEQGWLNAAPTARLGNGWWSEEHKALLLIVFIDIHPMEAYGVQGVVTQSGYTQLLVEDPKGSAFAFPHSIEDTVASCGIC